MEQRAKLNVLDIFGNAVSRSTLRGKRDAALIGLLLRCGLRRSEAVNLRILLVAHEFDSAGAKIHANLPSRCDSCYDWTLAGFLNLLIVPER